MQVKYYTKTKMGKKSKINKVTIKIPIKVYNGDKICTKVRLSKK